MRNLRKKGQITNNLGLLVLASIMFVVIIVIVVVGANVTTTLKDNVGRSTLEVDNESDSVNLLWVNNTNMTLDNTDATVQTVYSCNDSTTISADNYTVFSALGIIQIDDNSTAQIGQNNMTCVNYTFLDVYVMGATNYTVFGEEGKILGLINGTTVNDSDAMCVNYSYLERNAAFNVSGQGEVGLSTFGDYFGVIATIIILVIIVGLLIGVIVLFQRSR